MIYSICFAQKIIAVNRESELSALQVNFISLGCAKNLVDTEKMLGLLAEAGLFLVGSEDPSDVMVINTCGFVAEARQEARENIEFALKQKEQGRIGAVVVCGCLAQLWQDRLKREFPTVDAVVSLADRDKIAEVVRYVADRRAGGKDKKKQLEIQWDSFDRQVLYDQARLRLTQSCWTYLRISEGCDQKCTFCTIPAIRGRFRSKPLEAILTEARELVGDGAVEVNLIGQETSSYGTDLRIDGGLAQLLSRLEEIEDLAWVRILYAHPATLTDEQIKAMAEYEKVVPYLDIPLQHINDRILRMMNRHVTRRSTEKLLNKLRSMVDNISIRTTMLVGFPGETGDEFAELLEFVKEQRFEALGVFAYSPEENTPAINIKEQVPYDVKIQRQEQLMIAQQEIAFAQADGLIGSARECLIVDELEEEDREELGLPGGEYYVARHEGQAPEIDGECYLTAESDMGVAPGDIVTARITRQFEYDLIGQIERI